MIDIRQSENYAKYIRAQGWINERINNSNYFIKKLPIIGSMLKIQRPKKIEFKTISRLEKKYRVFQTIIVPDLASVINSFSDIRNLLSHNGYKLSKSPFLPSKTIHLDLNQSKEDIFRNFSKDCKYSIRKGEGLEVREHNSPKEIEVFYKAWKKSVSFNRYIPSLQSLLDLKKSFPQYKCTFLASHNKYGRIIGGAIFTTSSHKRSNYITYYWYGFTNSDGRTSLSQYSLLYHGILWAKRHGSKVFDFEGIYDERFPNKSWLGFTHFKKSFGGKELLYPGCYTKFTLSNLFNFNS